MNVAHLFQKADFVSFITEASKDEESGGAAAAGCFGSQEAFTLTPCPRESLLSDFVKVKSSTSTVRQGCLEYLL